MADLVLSPPHPAVGWHRYRDQATGTDDAGHFAERPDVIVEMLEDVERGDQVESAIRKRDCLGRSEAEILAGPRGALAAQRGAISQAVPLPNSMRGWAKAPPPEPMSMMRAGGRR